MKLTTAQKLALFAASVVCKYGKEQEALTSIQNAQNRLISGGDWIAKRVLGPPFEWLGNVRTLIVSATLAEAPAEQERNP